MWLGALNPFSLVLCYLTGACKHILNLTRMDCLDCWQCQYEVLQEYTEGEWELHCKGKKVDSRQQARPDGPTPSRAADAIVRYHRFHQSQRIVKRVLEMKAIISASSAQIGQAVTL
jgi:hypothetical protein